MLKGLLQVAPVPVHLRIDGRVLKHIRPFSSEDESDLPQAEILKLTIAKLDESLKTHDVQRLQHTLLNGLLKVGRRSID